MLGSSREITVSRVLGSPDTHMSCMILILHIWNEVLLTPRKGQGYYALPFFWALSSWLYTVNVHWVHTHTGKACQSVSATRTPETSQNVCSTGWAWNTDCHRQSMWTNAFLGFTVCLLEKEHRQTSGQQSDGSFSENAWTGRGSSVPQSLGRQCPEICTRLGWLRPSLDCSRNPPPPHTHRHSPSFCTMHCQICKVQVHYECS